MNARIRAAVVATVAAGCVIPPPATPIGPYQGRAPSQAEADQRFVAEESTAALDVVVEGRWLSEDHVASGDLYLELTGYADRHVEGLWGRYVCDGTSCTKGKYLGLVKGQLDAGGTGWIDLESLGRSNSFSWTVTSTSPETLAIEVTPDFHAIVIRR